jgi:hypothetical protein
MGWDYGCIAWPFLEVSGQFHAPAALTPGKEPVGPRAGLDIFPRTYGLPVQ